MRDRSLFRWSWPTISALGFLLASLALIVYARTQAQASQVCRTVEQVQICGTLDPRYPANDPRFVLGGSNLTIGPANGPPLLRVSPSLANTSSVAFEDRNGDGIPELVVDGGLGFLADANSAPLIRTAGAALAEVLRIDPISGEIFNDPALRPAGVAQNSSLAFEALQRTGLAEFFGGVQTNPIRDADIRINILQRRLSAVLPVDNLRLTNPSGNDQLPVVVRFSIDLNGNFNGSVDNFSMKLAGLTVQVKNVALSVSGSTASFEAGTADVLRSENPGMPNFDRTQPTMVLQLKQIVYRNGALSVAGGSIPIADLEFGNGFSLRQVTFGLQSDASGTTINLNARLRMGELVRGSSETPVSMVIAAVNTPDGVRPRFSGTINEINTTLSDLRLQLKTVTITGDPTANFFGISAQTVDATWPQSFGGSTKTGITGFRLGINSQGQLIFNLGGATLELPPIDTGVLRGSVFQGTIAVDQNNVSLTIDGMINVILPANAGVAPSAQIILRSGRTVCGGSAAPSNCLRPFDASLTGFSLRAAGFNLGLQNVKFLQNGGFEAENFQLGFPAGVGGSAGIVIQGLTVDRNGSLNIRGGGFEIPNFQVAGISFGGFRGSFERDTFGYRFAGAATLSLPGLDPSGGNRITAEIEVSTAPSGAFRQLGVIVEFEISPGIPIGQTGTALTGMRGRFSLATNTGTIGVGISISSIANVAGISAFRVDADADLQINPLRFSMNARLTLLIFEVAQASMEMGDGAGFNGRPGFNAEFSVNLQVVRGSVDVRIGKINNVNRFRGGGDLRVGVERNQFGPFLPPRSINVARVGFTFSEFQRNNTRTLGLKGSVRIAFFGRFSVFVNLSRRPNQSGFIIFGANANAFRETTTAQFREAIRNGETGYFERQLSLTEAQNLGYGARPGLTQIGITVPVSQTGSTLIGLMYPPGTGEPTIRLELPSGEILTEGTIISPSQYFLREMTEVVTIGNNLAYILQEAEIGTYTLLVDNPPDDYSLVSYQLNEPPALENVVATRDGDDVTISWEASDIDSPDARVSISYNQIITPTAIVSESTELANSYLITEQLSLSETSFTWPLIEVPTGDYRIEVLVDDGENAPTIEIAELVISVVDEVPPAVPQNLTATPGPGQLLINWDMNNERDLAGYEVGFGFSADPATFVYSRTIGPKEPTLEGIGSIDATLWGIEDNQEIFYAVRAYDQSGNYSAWSAAVSGRPWALSPRAWNPLPETISGTLPLEIAFFEPLDEETLTEGVLTLVGSGGQPIAGELRYLTDNDGEQIFGLRFTPSASLPVGEYTATLRGGAEGVSALDGRQMAADFVWRFTTLETFTPIFQVYLPLNRVE